MAATLTDAGTLTYASFPIEKTETNADGDLVVYGKASDGSIDADQQIVKPEWMTKAIAEWFDSGPNLRVQHNAQRDPAGVGLTWNTDASGATWVKGLVGEPVAKKLVSMGALRAYSVGIARPTIERDVTGKARGGIITDGTLVEISLVDRPANKSCGIQLVKSADDGTPEFTGKVFGDEDVIAKFTGGDVIGKADMTFEAPEDMSLTFTPNDLAKILKSKIIDQHYEDLAAEALFAAEAEVYKRNVNTAERRSLASAGNALPNGSYPIANAGDLGNAAHLAQTGHGDAEGAKKLIARRAQELGVANPLTDNDDSKKEESLDGGRVAEAAVIKEADPDITKDPVKNPGKLDADGDYDGDGDAGKGIPKAAKKAKKPAKGKKMPPWMQDDDSKGDDDSGDSGSCKMDHAHTEKCMPSGTPQSASGASDAASMDEMPNPSAYQNTPMPAGRNTPEHKGMGMSPETAAILRFKSIGMDTDLGRLHDLTCPAFSPDEVAKYHPFASFADLIDEDLWMRKAVDAATGPIKDAMAMTEVWRAVQTLKGADVGDLNDFRLEMHKAFRDANPGPTSYPSPGSMSPGKFKRPVITGGHAADSPGYGAPNSSATIPETAPSANSFGRPPLGAGHQSPSPSFMKGGDMDTGQYPAEHGVPVSLTYTHIEKDKARRALAMLHDHLSHQFPLGCPMIEQDAYRVDQKPPVPAIAGKAEDAKPEEVTVKEMNAALSGEFSDETLEKGMRKKLAKKVLSGKLTIDEARSKLGRARAQKSQDFLVDAVEKGIMTIDEARAKMGLGPWSQPREINVQAPPVIKERGVTYLSAGDPNLTPSQIGELQESLNKMAGENVGKIIVLPMGTKVESTPLEPIVGKIGNDPEVIKTAVAEAIAPLMDKIEKQDKTISEQEARWEAAANLPDPKTASWAGLALNKNVRPAGVTTVAENAERTQVAHMRQAYHTWRSSENPFEREAARAELDKYGFTE